MQKKILILQVLVHTIEMPSIIYFLAMLNWNHLGIIHNHDRWRHGCLSKYLSKYVTAQQFVYSKQTQHVFIK